jgi:beta-lactamase class A
VNTSRRRTVALAAAAALAACRRPLTTQPKNGAGPLGTKVLNEHFQALADRARPGAFAFGVMNLATTATWYWNTDRGFALADAVALPIAVAAMALVEQRKLSLAQNVAYTALDLSPPPSLIGHAWPSPPDKRHAVIGLEALMTLALRQHDNTAIDVLMRQAGGPGGVGAFLQFKGVTGLRVDRYQREIDVDMFGMPPFRSDWKDAAAFDVARGQIPAPKRQAAMDRMILDPRDTSTVPAALGFLGLLAAGQLISPPSVARLLGWMQSAGPSRFAPGLPEDVVVAHASGQTPTDLGFTPATTELAIASFPRGRRYAMAGFLVGSTATEAARNALFAQAAQLAARAIG